MNFRYLIRQVGMLSLVVAIAMLVPLAYSALQARQGVPLETEALTALGIGTGAAILVGLILILAGRRGDIESMGRREALLLVAISWIGGSALAAVPFYTFGLIAPDTLPDSSEPYTAGTQFHSLANCYFEAVSGLTTTGATILSDIQGLPRGLLLWRSLTHWLGGVGIVVLFVAVLPMLGIGGKKLFQIESAGPQQQGVRPRISETARVLWIIYCTLTLANIISLKLAGLDWFNAVCHTFGTVATGGFSPLNASVGHYRSPLVDWITIGFMVLGAVNFGLYYRLVNRQFASVWKDTELRVFLAILIGATLLIMIALGGSTLFATTGDEQPVDFVGAATPAAFQATSLMTTTGFATYDFNRWPFFTDAILLGLMLLGGCAGSTTGGLKIIRIIVAAKVVWNEIERVFRPNVVRTLRVNGSPIDEPMRLAVVGYVLLLLTLFAFGSVAIIVLQAGGQEIDFVSAATASLACLFNVGPGLHSVGPMENFDFFTPAAKLLLSLWMILGRLEVFAVIVLFHPRFWTND
ncbi:MAG: TrkH family potassium uptake protein [Planctomycetota bacterium]